MTSKWEVVYCSGYHLWVCDSDHMSMPTTWLGVHNRFIQPTKEQSFHNKSSYIISLLSLCHIQIKYMQVQIWISLTFPSITFSTNRSRRVWRLIVKEIDLCSVHSACPVRWDLVREKNVWRVGDEVKLISEWYQYFLKASTQSQCALSTNLSAGETTLALSLSLSLSLSLQLPLSPGPSVSQSVSPTCAQRGRETPWKNWSIFSGRHKSKVVFG